MYFTKSQLKQSYAEDRIITESINEDESLRATFDIFLSHSYSDKIYIAKLKEILEKNYNYTVYVDWITDKITLDRDKGVTKDTADKIRSRLKQSNSMIFATSSNTPNSKWMPWELGYYDSFSSDKFKISKIGILPITDNTDDNFEGQEYLGLYPVVTEQTSNKTHKKKLWVRKSSKIYVAYDEWLYENKQPYEHK